MADGLLSNILNFIDQRKQSTMAGLGLLANNPQEYFTGRAEQLRDFTRAQEAGLPAERNQMRGLLVSPEQQAAQQYANQQLQDLVLGFTGNVKPTGLLSKAGQQLPAVPETMYHGTASDIQAFRPGNTVYVSPSPKFAESYAGTQSPNIMPLRADVTKPFNYESAADIQKLAETYKKLHGEDLFSKKTISSSGGEMKLSQLDKNPISQRLKSGDWTIIEDKKVQEAIKKAGFDAFYIEEGGVKNLGVYDPTKLKSVFSSGENVKPAGLLGTEATKKVEPKSELIKIYRGSYEESPLYKVEENYKGNDIFGGVFGSPSLSSAKSHGGGAVHYTEIPKNKILTQNDLSYQIPFEDTKKALLKARPDLKNNSELFDEVYNIVINDSGQNLYNYSDDFINKAFKTTDFGEAGFEAQRLRGQVSKNLGYKAVEVMDEHGTSYLVAPGSQFKKVKK